MMTSKIMDVDTMNQLNYFVTYLFMIRGRMLYETLEANLPLSSVNTISRTMSKIWDCIVKGEFCAKELKCFFQNREICLQIYG